MEIFSQTYQKIIFKTPTEEIKKIKKIGLWVTILSLFLLLISVYKSGISQLKCSKEQETKISCKLKKTNLMGLYTSENFDIDNIINFTYSNKQVLILSQDKKIYWSPYQYDYIALNNWLNNPRKNAINIKNGNILKNIILLAILTTFLIAGLQMFKNKGESMHNV